MNKSLKKGDLVVHRDFSKFMTDAPLVEMSGSIGSIGSTSTPFRSGIGIITRDPEMFAEQRRRITAYNSGTFSTSEFVFRGVKVFWPKENRETTEELYAIRKLEKNE